MKEQKLTNHIIPAHDGKYILTENGLENIQCFIKNLQAKRKEILDAGQDTADDTNLPDVEDIFTDAVENGFDEDGESYNCWGVTDNYDSDGPVVLKLGKDVILDDAE